MSSSSPFQALVPASQAHFAATPAIAEAGDELVIAMWLHNRPVRTVQEYRRDYHHFRRFCATPLPQLSLAELQTYANSLSSLSSAGQARKLSAIKSLLRFGHRLGYLAFDVGGMLRLPVVVGSLAQRIAPEEVLKHLIELETDQRNKLLLLFLYASGGRVSEVAAVTWRDVLAGDGGAGQVRLEGKGQKERVVFLPPVVYSELVRSRGRAGDEQPVLAGSHTGKRLTRTRIWAIVKTAAARAGYEKISPHWFRHAHASHALDRGASVALVKATLGHASLATTGKYLHARPKDGSARYLDLE